MSTFVKISNVTFRINAGISRLELVENIKNRISGFENGDIFNDFQLLHKGEVLDERYFHEKKVTYPIVLLEVNSKLPLVLRTELVPVLYDSIGFYVPKGQRTPFDETKFTGHLGDKFRTAEYRRSFCKVYKMIRDRYPQIAQVQKWNIVQALTQSGKTRFTCCLLYVGAQIGLVSLGAVQDKGGRQHAQRFVQEIEEINAFYNRSLTALQMTNLEINVDHVRTKCDRETRLVSGEMEPTILLFNRNKTLENVVKMVGMLPLFGVNDEEDVACMSMSKDAGVAEKVTSQKTFEELGGETIDSRYSFWTAITATPSRVITNDKELILNVITLPTPTNHKGFYSEDPANKIQRVVYDPIVCPEGYNTKTFKKGLIQSGLDQINHDFRNKETYKYISALFIDDKASRIEVQTDVAIEITKYLGNQCALTFPYNGNTKDGNFKVYLYGRPLVTLEETDSFKIDYNNGITSFSIKLDTGVGKIATISDMYTAVIELSNQLELPGTFINCVAHAMANRGTTMKPKDHSHPLTHMVASAGDASNLDYLVQMLGRINSVDNYDIPRKAFMTSKMDLGLDLWYKNNQEFVMTASGKTCREILRTLPHESMMSVALANSKKRKGKSQLARMYPNKFLKSSIDFLEENVSKEAPVIDNEIEEEIIDEDNSLDKIPTLAYQRSFDQDLQNAATFTSTITSLEDKVKVWTEMELICDKSSNGRKTWVFICENFIRGGEILDMAPVVTKSTIMPTLIRYNQDNNANGRRSFRSTLAKGKHITVMDNLMKLSWK